MRKDLARPSDTPFGTHEVDYGDRELEEARARYLDSSLEWHVSGLLPALLQLDKSLYGLYADGANVELPIKTHVTQEPLLYVPGAPKSKSPWFYTLQGIPKQNGKAVRDFVASYRFRTPDGQQWRGRWDARTIQDPLSTNTHAVEVWVLSVKSMFTGREFRAAPAPSTGQVWTAIPVQITLGVVEPF